MNLVKSFHKLKQKFFKIEEKTEQEAVKIEKEVEEEIKEVEELIEYEETKLAKFFYSFIRKAFGPIVRKI